MRIGSFRTVLADDALDVWAFVRESEGEEVLVVASMSERAQRVPLPIELGGGWPPILGDVPADMVDRFPDVVVGPISARVWLGSMTAST